MKKNFEQLHQPRIELFQFVAVHPEISEREIEPDYGFRNHIPQSAVVEIESGGRQTRKRFGIDADVAVSVDKQVLKCQTIKRPRFNRLYPVIT